MGPSREMSISEAIEVLGIEDQYKTDDFTVELIEERHEKMIEINQKGKIVSPYLVAKINNAKDSAIVAALMEAEKNNASENQNQAGAEESKKTEEKETINEENEKSEKK